MKKVASLSLILAFIYFGISCSKDISSNGEYPSPELPQEPYDYTKIDANSELLIITRDNTPFDNPMSDWGATLGRVLFYDGALSVNNTVACGSCHHQQLAFADAGKESIGFEGKRTPRNSPPIMNMRFAQNFFWDFSVSSLEQQVMMPVKNHIEMGMEDLDFLATKLEQIDYYPELFKKSFGTNEITPEKISKALSQFIRSIVSVDSKFDHAVAAQNDFASFDELERHGMDVFLESGCNGCHTVIPFLFGGPDHEIIEFPGGVGGYAGTGEDLANIGLDMEYADNGAGEGVFKVPSLRNISFTAPYMHDGRFQTLNEVIDHYAQGIQNHDFLDFRLKDFETNQPRRLELSLLDRTALIKFLQTLNDENVLTDPKFSNPFSK
jgi:cytochrome c peroxidase